MARVSGKVGARRHPAVAAMATFFYSVVLYFVTMAPDLTWANSGADGGELITAAVTLGIPHPPGYPTFTLLGKLFSYFPVGNVAYRFNAFSGLCMAISTAILALLTAEVVSAQFERRRQREQGARGQHRLAPLYAGIFTGTTFASIPIVWKQAIIAEVYALNMLAVSLFLFFSLQRKERRRHVLVGLTLGLAVTTHLTSLLLLPLAVVSAAARRPLRFLAGFAGGLAPFLLIPVFAGGASPVIWGAPQTLAGHWWLVSAKIYQPNVLALPLAEWTSRAALWSAEPSIWLGGALLAVAVFRRRHIRANQEAPLVAALASVWLYLAYAFGYNAPDSLFLTLPAFGLLTVLSGTALQRAAPWLLALPLVLVVLNFQGIDLSQHGATRSLAEAALREAPRNSIVLTSGDHTTFALWYLQHVEGQRGDLVLIDENLFAFDWYRKRLTREHPDLQGLEVDDLSLLRASNAQRRPWCQLTFEPYRTTAYWCTKEPI